MKQDKTISGILRRRMAHRAISLSMRALLVIGISVACALLSASTQAQDNKKPDLTKAGTVEIEQYQVAFLYSGNLGGGKLTFNNKVYPFTIGGLGIGGIGASKIEATGQVYNLRRAEDFPGAYGQARWGYAAGDTSKGSLWLQNADGVVIELAAKRTGAALSLGGDAVYFAFK
jgi:hypothetical protein